MHFKEENHNESCGFCSTSVPQNAIVCTGCGARWGTSTGASREDVYSAGKKTMITGLAIIALILCLVIACFFNSLYYILLLIVATFGGPVALGLTIGGLLKMRSAKNAKISWWRNS